MSKFVRIAFVAILAAAFAPAHASDVITLKGQEGFDFIKKSVTKKGDANTDLSVVAVAGRKGAIAAKKIKSLGQAMPDARAFLTIQSWPASVETPTPGYYAVEGRDGKSIYLVQLSSFADYGKPATWEVSFTWERLQ